MLVGIPDHMKVGEWFIADETRTDETRNRWWVTHRPSESQWHMYGPYDSKEEAIEESGMPKPKTELEELWEVAGKMSDALSFAKIMTLHSEVYGKVGGAIIDFNELARKYKKT